MIKTLKQKTFDDLMSTAATIAERGDRPACFVLQDSKDRRRRLHVVVLSQTIAECLNDKLKNLAMITLEVVQDDFE